MALNQPSLKSNPFRTAEERDSAVKAEPHVPCLPVVDEHTNHFEKGIFRVTDGVYVAIGYALANSICVETANSLVIIDVLEDVTSARIVCKKFKELCNNKPIKAVIFTHGHIDHTNGILAFTENEPEEPKVYFHKECIDAWKSTLQFSGGTYVRAYRQFGTLLSHQLPESNATNWFKNAGIGPHLNHRPSHEDSFLNMKNAVTFEGSYEFTIDNLTFYLQEAFGESNDQLFVLVSKLNLLLCGDNYYKSFPNIYAIRGVSARNGYKWYKSIESFMNCVKLYNVKYMIPSHGQYLFGNENIYNKLELYRDGIAFIYDQTVRYLNQAYDPSDIVTIIKKELPPQVFGIDSKENNLLEFYGTIEWSVKAIATQILGWFYTGKPVDLFPASKQMRGDGMLSLLQYVSNNNDSNDKSMERMVVDYVQSCLDARARDRSGMSLIEIDNQNRSLLEIITWLRHSIRNRIAMNGGNTDTMMMSDVLRDIQDIRYEIMRNFASYQTSMPARNYLLTYILEEKYDWEPDGLMQFNWYKNILVDWMIFGFSFYVIPKECQKIMRKDRNTGLIILNDVQKTIKLQLKKIGVMQIEEIDYNKDYSNDDSIDWIISDDASNVRNNIVMIVQMVRKRDEAMIKKTGVHDISTRSHDIPRIRTSVALFLERFRMVANMKGKSIEKGHDMAKEFFQCLESKTLSKL